MPAALRRWLRDDAVQTAAWSWLLARLVFLVGWAVAVVAADELRPGDRPLQLDQGLFAWDAAFYRDIADVGYGGLADEALRFFPLLPLLARGLGAVAGGAVGAALVVLVQVFAFAAAVVLHRLTLRETGDRDVARRVTWLFALLPPAAVLVLGYAEALFVLLAAGAFLAVRTGRWWLAVPLGFLLGLARPVGMTLALPAAIEALRGVGSAPRGVLLARAAAVAAPMLGAGAYLGWAERVRGDWQLPLRLQNSADLRGGWRDPVATVVDAVRAVDDGLGEALHLPWIALFLLLLVVVFLRLPVSYGAWTAVLLLSALTGQTLGSFERYGLAAFPLLLALALVARPPIAERALLVASAAGLGAFTTLTFVGAFVP